VISPNTTRTLVLSLLLTPPALAQGDSVPSIQEELEALQAENAELARRIDLVASELEREKVGTNLVPPLDPDGKHGLGPAGSKVYNVDRGISLGGYGDFLFEHFNDGDGRDTFDALRVVLYVGYKFDERWVFNSELEFEHGTTSSTQDQSGGSVSVEFAYLDYLATPAANFRGGLVLAPVGFVNEVHEPTTYLTAKRTVTETRILPTTWREPGVGIFGDAGGFTYRSYVMSSLQGEGFTDQGLRGGRQNGNRAESEDLAWVGRLDYADVPGLLIGASAFWGGVGQNTDADATTTIAEGHVQWQRSGWWFRLLGSWADVNGADELNAIQTPPILPPSDASVGERLTGAYVTLGYDVLSIATPESEQRLTPFVQYEAVDTQAEVPTGYTRDASNDLTVLTVGLNYMPLPNVAFKLDYQDIDDDAGATADQVNFAISYVF
jgi:hypothetical protein